MGVVKLFSLLRPPNSQFFGYEDRVSLKECVYVCVLRLNDLIILYLR